MSVAFSKDEMVAAVRARFGDSVVLTFSRAQDGDVNYMHLTSTNYTNRSIDGIMIHKAGSDLPRLLQTFLTADLLALADQLEWVASQIRKEVG
jgi:hypothetical protein